MVSHVLNFYFSDYNELSHFFILATQVSSSLSCFFCPMPTFPLACLSFTYQCQTFMYSGYQSFAMDQYVGCKSLLPVCAWHILISLWWLQLYVSFQFLCRWIYRCVYLCFVLLSCFRNAPTEIFSYSFVFHISVSDPSGIYLRVQCDVGTQCFFPYG